MGVARANAYAALEGLVRHNAALRTPGKPTRYRAIDPQGLLLQLAAEQGERLEQLSRVLGAARSAVEPVTRTFEGSRAAGNVVHQLVARAERDVVGVIEAGLWQATVPAWRRATARATLKVRVAGEATAVEGLDFPRAPAEHPTVLVLDGLHLLTASGSGATLLGIWSSQPLLVRLAQLALGVA